MEKKIAAGARKKLPKWFYPVWATNGTVMAIGVLLIGYATYYCTNILGLNPAVIGVLMMIARLTDLIVGYLIDHTHTKWGQARPYEIAIVFLFLFMSLFFATPNLSTTGKYVWVFIMYFMVTAICQTIIYGEDKVYLMNAVKDPENRNKVVSFSGAIMMVFTIAFGIVMPQLIMAAGTDASAWTKMALVLAVPCTIIGVLRLIFIKEYDVEETQKQEKQEKQGADLKTSVKVLFQNKYILIFTMIYFLYQLTTNINNVVGTYYYQYYIGNIGLASLTGLAAMATPLLLVFSPKLIQKFGTRKVLIVGSAAGLVYPVIRLLSFGNIPLLMLSSLVSTVAQVPAGLLLSIYIFECMEYGEWRSHVRIDGVISSMNSVAAKVAMGLSSILTGFILDACHYDGTLAVQPDSAMFAIHLLYNGLPIVFGIIGVIFAFKYDLEKKLPEIRKDMEARRAG